MKISGIYKIVNKVNGKYYIGSSNDIHRRWREHKCGLINNNHPNQYLQNSWNKYGKDNFDFIIISTFPTKNIDLILKEEERLLSIHCGNSKCFNINDSVLNLNGLNNPFYGRHHTNKTKKLMSNNKKLYYKNNIHPWTGRKHSKKSKEKNKNSHTGKYLGENGPSYDFTKYTFHNKKTNEIYTDTRYNFCKKYNLHMGNICWLIKGKHKSVKGWTIKNETNISIGLI